MLCSLNKDFVIVKAYRPSQHVLSQVESEPDRQAKHVSINYLILSFLSTAYSLYPKSSDRLVRNQ